MEKMECAGRERVPVWFEREEERESSLEGGRLNLYTMINYQGEGGGEGEVLPQLTRRWARLWRIDARRYELKAYVKHPRGLETS